MPSIPTPRLTRRHLHVAVATLLLTMMAAPAFADATVFLGSTTTPANRATRGLAFGMGLLAVGLEFEFSDAGEAAEDATPALRTGMGNVMLQTPVPIAGMTFYFTTGGGLYRERLGDHQETNLGVNTGGGMKISLLGPIGARLDYRVFRLRGEPLHSTVHRMYAALNVAF